MSDIVPTGATGGLTALLADPDKLRDFPVETLERLHAIHKEEREHQAAGAFNGALLAVQRVMQPVAKRAENRHTRSTYAKLEDVHAMLLPLLEQHGFSHSISGDESPKGEEWTRFVLTLRHEGGGVERHWIDAPIDHLGPKGEGVKTKLHGMGSSYTYAKRQLLCGVFGVQLADDVDGNHVAGTITEEQAADLQSMAEEAGLDSGQMAKLYQVLGVSRMSEIPETSYQLAWRELERKRRAAGRSE